MPATSTTFSGCKPKLASARWRAASTPKSPQPGHHQFSASVRKSLTVTVADALPLEAVLGKEDHLLNFFNDVLGKERIAVVLQNGLQPIRGNAVFPSVHVAELDELRQLTRGVVFHHDDFAGSRGQLRQ